MMKLRLFSLVLLLAPLVSCAVLTELLVEGKKPDARIVGVTPRSLDMGGVTLQFDVEVSNPYSAALPVTGIDYTLASDGDVFLQGEASGHEAIPAGQSMVIPVSARISFAETLRVLRGISPGAIVPYAADLGLSVDAPVVGALRVPLRREGELPVPTLPKVDLLDFHVEKLELTEARAVLRLEVQNTNRFDVGLNALDYSLSLGGFKIVAGSVESLPALGADAATTLAIPLSFSPAKLGFAVFRLLRGEGADYKLTGNMKLATPLGPLETSFDREGTTPLGR